MTDCSSKGYKSASEVPELQGAKSSIHKLNLSNNQLQDLDGMSGLMNLKVLHLDFNKLKTLETMPILLKLETLTVSSNLITDTQAAVKVIAMKCPRLIHLNLTNNPLDIDAKSEKYRKGVKKALGSLLSLDGVPYEGITTS